MKIKLSQVFDLQMGKTPSRNIAEYWGGDHKWVSIADIGNAGKYISETKECITDDGVSGSGIKVVPKGTVIMSFKLSIGKTAITSEDMYTNEAIMAFIDKGIYPVDPNYLYHLCYGTDWTAGTNKAVMGLTLNKATLSEKMINLPSVEEQKDIAEKLDEVDSLINIQQRQLAKLDELVKSRFIELFGDPVSNPKGWESVPLGKRCEIVTGNTPSRSEPENYGEYIEWIKSDNINTPFTFITTAQERLSEIGFKKCRFVEAGSLLMTCIAGSINCIGNVAVTDRRVAFNQQINAIVPEQDEVLYLYWLMLLSKPAIHSTINMALKGILSKGQLSELAFPFPPIELQEQFAAFVEQTDKSKLVVQRSLEKLETLKKSLMEQYFG